MHAPAPPIAIERLVKIYKTVPAVDGISFTLTPGSVTGLLGGNGAGKTTTIASIMGLTTPTSGRVTVLGAEMPRQRYRVLHRMNFESPYVAMPMRLTIRQNLTVFGMLYGVPDLAQRIKQIGEELDLTDLLDRQTGKLSDGQKTRVALAKGLINAPELLLLDEPTASLDPDTADWVRGRLERYRRERNATMLHCLAQHGRSRTAMRPRHHHEARPYRGRRHAGETAGALRPAHAGRGFSRRRPRPRHRARGGAMTTLSDGVLDFSPRRSGAMMLRYWYLLRSSWPRLLDLVYWPTVQMITWGFLQFYIMQNAGFFAKAGGTFIGAVLLWDILFRGQLGFSISFMEEMWARNIGNLMMSPLRPFEFITALMVMSIVRLAIGTVPVTFLAIAFFGFNLYGLGLALVAFFLNLMLTAWAVGIFVSGLVLRNGLGAENLAWSIMFLFMPLTCVYYPVSTLPAWLQPVSWALPPTYVFEGMRALLIEHTFRPDLMLSALALNVVFFAAGVFGFLKLLQSARRHGSLIQAGE